MGQRTQRRAAEIGTTRPWPLRQRFCGFVLAALTLPLAGNVSAQTPEFDPGEILVVLKKDSQLKKLPPVVELDPALQRSNRLISSRALTSTLSLLKTGATSQAETLEQVAALRKLPEVELAEPNYIRRIFRVPNDEHYPLQWHLRALNLEQAWDQSVGAPTVVIAIVDTGILKDHPDLQGRLVQGFDFISDPQTAADNDGWDADPEDAGTSDITSSGFHGTHVAGIIGSASNNGKGLAGVDWNCKVLPLRALGVDQGKGKDGDIVAAIQWSAGIQLPNAPKNPNPARVLNLSFGGPGASDILTKGIQDAQARGVIVVAAAGNHGTDGSNIYPAALPGVITVGATQYDGKLAPYSNYGKVIDIVAPGGNMSEMLPFQYQGKDWQAGIVGPLYSTPQQQYNYHLYEGTSQASPQVAGVVGLMLAANPNLNGNDVLQILIKTANPKGRCDKGCGTGIVDAAAAVREAALTKTHLPDPTLTDLPYGAPCANDTQCISRKCRKVGSTGAQVCTQDCYAVTACPAGSKACDKSLCVPETSMQTYSPGNPSAGIAVPVGTIYGSGCTVANSRDPQTVPRMPTAFALAVAALAVLRARRAHRRR